ncbi:ribulose-phosphate 3-epimerase [Pontibacter sp. Tf4]|uniref:ribulose-phosphate 3-epimerase n=1 Tax=Pontibacter sp. Tf4 TaxID=2761620 RepID=UPI0016265B32|nr:ribulose-phosphate 3-epimerase [Pontibacter sp. Tf4]MBB6610164.1 ribulose-phosphate 3-epimerase [Pontibacter sp. Tf4]
MRPLIAPSVLASDFANLQSEVEMLNKSHADWLHIDIMDGRFVPNISFGFPVMESIKKHAQKPMDVHLMIVEPELYIERFRAAGADVISVHIEASNHLHRTIQQIKATGAKAGVAVNPHTSVSLLDDIIADLDLVCIMSVNPGFGGQKFIENTYRKTEALKNLIIQRNSEALIEIDGGVNQQNAPKLVESGADVLVAGSFVFSAADPIATIADLKNSSK